MSKMIGRLATLEISDDGITYTAIGELSSISPSWSTDMADETTNDSAGFKEEQPADSQLSLDAGGKYDPSDAGQAALAAAATGKLKKYFRFRPTTGSTEPEWTFQGHIPEFSVDTETGSVEDLSVSIQSTGTVTFGTQT